MTRLVASDGLVLVAALGALALCIAIAVDDEGRWWLAIFWLLFAAERFDEYVSRKVARR